MNRALARNTDPETSFDAAKSLSDQALSRLESLIVGALEARPDGLTVPEIAAFLGLSVITVSPRIRPMVNRGLVVDTGVKKLLPGHTRMCIIWNLSRCGVK